MRTRKSSAIRNIFADGVNHSSNRFERQYEDIANALDPTRRATHGSPVTVSALFPFSAIFKVDLFWLAWSLSCHLSLVACAGDSRHDVHTLMFTQ